MSCEECGNKAARDCDYGLCGQCCDYRNCSRHGFDLTCEECGNPASEDCDYQRCRLHCGQADCPRHGSDINCSVCSRYFWNQNALDQHMQTHRPRNVGCPMCGARRFRSGAGVAQHIEGGWCSECGSQGRSMTRDFVRRNAPHLFQRALEDGNAGNSEDEDFECRYCQRTFRTVGGLMQHQESRPQCRGTAALALVDGPSECRHCSNPAAKDCDYACCGACCPGGCRRHD